MIRWVLEAIGPTDVEPRRFESDTRLGAIDLFSAYLRRNSGINVVNVIIDIEESS